MTLRAAALVVIAVSACAPARDTVPVMPETRTDAGAATTDGYVAVAKLPHVTMALASHAGVQREAALQYLERIASEAEACATQLQKQAQLASGAGQFTAKKKSPETLVDLRTEGGPKAAHNAVLCVVAPLRRLPFPDAPENSTLVFEAIWAPN